MIVKQAGGIRSKMVKFNISTDISLRASCYCCKIELKEPAGTLVGSALITSNIDGGDIILYFCSKCYELVWTGAEVLRRKNKEIDKV